MGCLINTKRLIKKLLPARRYIIAAICFLGFTNMFVLRTNVSIALVAMVSRQIVYREGSWIEEAAEFNWSTELQGVIQGALYYGLIFSVLPGGVLAHKCGGKNVFGYGLLSSSVCTLLIPLACRTSVLYLIAIRVLSGVFEGGFFPSNTDLWSRWAPPLERSRLTTIAVSGCHLGTIMSMVLSGVIAKSLGWPAIFYIFGITGILTSILWFEVVKNSPKEDPHISTQELDMIERSIQEEGASIKASHKPVPWCTILRSLPVWAINIAFFSDSWGFYMLHISMPFYLKETLGFDIVQTGFLSALPFVAMAIVVQLGGRLADFLLSKNIFSTTITRKMFTVTGFFTQALFLLILAYNKDWKKAVVLLTISYGFGGLPYSGHFVSHLDVAPKYAGLLMSISCIWSALPAIFSPLLTGVIVQHHQASEWRVIFWITAAFYAFGSIFYMFFGSAEIQCWATENSSCEDISQQEM